MGSVLDYVSVSELTGSEQLYVVQNDEDRKVSPEQIAQYVLDQIPEPVLKNYEIFNKSPNLYNPNARILDKYLSNTTGRLSKAVGWSVSEYIAVTPGEKLTISYEAKRVGIAFAENVGDLDVKNAIQYISDSVSPTTLTVPANANWIVLNIDSNVITSRNVQLERGTVASAYRPYGDSYTLDYNALVNIPASITPKVTVDQGRVIMTSTVDGTPIELSMLLQQATSGVLNFSSDTVAGKLQRTPTDDHAPVHMDEATIGGNHGYSWTQLTSTAHGKTVADVGSVWTVNGLECVLVTINSANQLSFTMRNSNTAVPVGLMTHVSGGVNKTSFTTTAASPSQWYTPLRDRKLSVYADDVKLDLLQNKTHEFKHAVKFFESYSIMKKSDMVEWLIAHPGHSSLTYDAVPALTVSLSYSFDHELGCTVYYTGIGRREVTLKDIMVVQASPLNTANGPVEFYVPKSKAFTQDSFSFDLTAKEVLSTKPFTSRMLLDASRLEDPESPIDRILMLNTDVGYVTGYLPVLDALPARRKDLASLCYIEIRNATLKLYPHLVDSLDHSLLKDGDVYASIAYRKYFKRSADRTAQYVVRSTHGDYLFLDWHQAKTDEVNLPSDLVGREFDIVEKSANVTLLSPFASNTLLVKVDATKNYGYLVLRFK